MSTRGLWLIFSFGFACAICPRACQAQTVYTTNFNLSTPLSVATSGSFDTRTVSGAPSSIGDINVIFNISSDYNGELYVYLRHEDSEQIAVLLNRVGRRPDDAGTPEVETEGYDDKGFDITLDDSGADVHTYRLTLSGSHATPVDTDSDLSNREALTGTWGPDARKVDPSVALDSTARTSFLSTFNGLDPNGDWTLFLSKHSDFGAQNHALNSWGLEITAVPEPAGGVLAGLLCLAGAIFMKHRKRNES